MRCPSPPLKMGPTWVEVHATAQEREALDRKTPMWDNMMKHKGSEDSDWDKDDAVQAKCQFEDATTPASTADVATVVPTEDPMDESPVVAPPEQKTEALVEMQSQDVVQIHVGEDDDLE